MMIPSLQISTILLLITVLTSCTTECREVTKRYENQEVKEARIYTYCGDSIQYKIEHYYESGQIAWEGEIKMGRQTGQFKSWFENGQLSAEWRMLNDLEHGTIKCWYENGQLKKIGTLDRGVENGMVREWDSDGALTFEGDFVNGMKHGKLFFGEGRGTKKIRTYENGILQGFSWEHLVDSTGKVTIVVGSYRDNKEEGIWTWLNKDSVVTETMDYVQGKQTGAWTVYYPNGKIKMKAPIKDDFYYGIIEHYDSTGRLVRKEDFKTGETVK